MKFFSFALLSSLAIRAYASTPTPTKRQVTTPPGFVKSVNGRFELDGKPFYFIGTNAYWLAQLDNPDDVVKTLTEIKSNLIKVVRVWAFNDVVDIPPNNGAYFQLWSKGQATINYGPNGLQRLDHIMRTAEALNIKIQLVLTNNWTPSRKNDNRVRGVASNDYGGMDIYVQQLFPGAPHDHFYDDDRVKAAFRKYIAVIVSRYSNSTALFAWELANDPRCIGAEGYTTSGNCKATTITKWTAEQSRYIKTELDPNHLSASGDGGFYCLDCTKIYASPAPATVSPAARRGKAKREYVPAWKQLKGNGPWTKASMLAFRIEQEKEQAKASRRSAIGSVKGGAKIRGRWSAPAPFKYKYHGKRQDGSDTDFGPGYDGSYDVDHDDLGAVPDIDYSTFQFFPDQNQYSESSDTSAVGAGADTDETIRQGNEWIQTHSESSTNSGKPTLVSAFGYVGTDSSNYYVPFNSSSLAGESSTRKRQSTGSSNQQQFSNSNQQQTGYNNFVATGIKNNINGIIHNSWGQTGLTSKTGTVVDDDNDKHTGGDSDKGKSPDDGYASYTKPIKDILKKGAQDQNTKYGQDSD